MPDDHRAPTKRGGQPPAIMRGVASEHEIRGRRQNLEAKPDQAARSAAHGLRSRARGRPETRPHPQGRR